MKSLPELLAPAGEKAAAYAAFAFGADAIYTGLPRFSARAEAVNLTPADLAEVCAYAHGQPRPRRVYVTLNTLIRTAETADLLRSLALCADCGADAVIVQDLGVARLARRHYPELRLHASTQLAIHNLEGCRAAARLGFKRATLARELTLDEIRAIAAASPIEVETFAHGALCYSYSGLCLYSALLRGRSGNRGACAYPCRDAFTPVDGGGNGDDADSKPRLAFAMKDLCTAPCLHDLVRTGAASLKIEGRKKSPLYVAAAVRLYRGLLDGTFTPAERAAAERDLQTVFSRPTTDLHLRSRWNPSVLSPDATGHLGAPLGRVELATRTFLQFRTELPLEVHDGIQFLLPNQTRPHGFPVEEITLSTGRSVYAAPAGTLLEVPLPPGTPYIPKGTPLHLASSQTAKRRLRFDLPNPREWRKRTPVALRLAATTDQLTITATAGTSTTTHAWPGPFPPAKDPGKMARALRESFAKLGDTPFALATLDIDGTLPFVPVSRLNDMRREWSTALADALQAAADARLADALSDLEITPLPPPPTPTQKPFLVKTDAPSAFLAAYPDGDLPPRVTELCIELDGRPATTDAIARLSSVLPPRIALRLALPMIVRAWDREPLLAQIRHHLDLGHRLWEAANISSLDLLPKNHPDLDLSADWPLYALNPQAAAAWRDRGITRLTISPEDTEDNALALASAAPGPWVWPVRSDPPLFISENCSHAAATGACPRDGRCGYSGETLRNRAGETIRIIPRHCRFYTLSDAPTYRPLPPDSPFLPRADYLLRPLDPATLRQDLASLAR
ncbi:MAG: U32 family peptidase [Kiritimatiellae bacterium]|nr:U32 family peptidase [Kiritimatiellia bacterium]